MSNSIFNGVSIGIILAGCYAFFMQTYSVALDVLRNTGTILTGAAQAPAIPDSMFLSFIVFGFIGCAITGALNSEHTTGNLYL